VPSRFLSLAALGTVLPVNLQVTVLKVLVSYPDGLARFDDLKRDMAFLATCGKDWPDRTKWLATRIPDLAIFCEGLVERLEGGWRITQQGPPCLGNDGSAIAPRSVGDRASHGIKPERNARVWNGLPSRGKRH
jgi:hypothetical protein